METFNVSLVGVGGQGILLTANLLGRVAALAGLDVKKSEIHGMAQRGGSVASSVRFGERVCSPIIPAGESDLLVAFDRLEALREADAIVREEIGAMPEVPWQYFCAIPDFKSTGIKDGKRYMGWAVVIRAINTVDAVTAESVEIPWSTLTTIRDRIIETVPGVNRVLWDISDKPVSTIEWE